MFYSEKEFESFNNTIMKVKDINKELDMKLDKLKLEESGDIDVELEEEFDINIEESSDSDDIDIDVEDEAGCSTQSRAPLEEYFDNFLECVFNEEAVEISEKIRNFKESTEIGISEYVKTFSSINESNLDPYTKEILLFNLFESFNDLKENNIIKESYLLEFSGNEEKNKELIRYLNLMQERIEFYMVYMKEITDFGDKLLDNCKKAAKSKNVDQVKKVFNDLRCDTDDFISMIQKKYSAKMQEQYKNFKKYEKLRKKFNNKYSSECMEAKKKIDPKLEALYNQFIKSEATEWIAFNEGDKPQKWFEICDCYDKIKRIDVDYAGAFCKYINWYIDVLVDGCRFMLSFINYIRHTLDIEFEDSVRYKIIQRILKDNNKSGGYSEEKKEITFTC